MNYKKDYHICRIIGFPESIYVRLKVTIYNLGRLSNDSKGYLDWSIDGMNFG